MEDYLKHTIETYNRIAKDYVYTTQNRRPQLEFDLFCQAVIPGGQVLDVGCGWGRDCQALIARGFSVTGVDLSAEMLKLARKLILGCTFLEADLRTIPLGDQSVDGIWCCASLLHLERSELARALTEFKRLLKVGASCCIIVKKGFGEGVVEHSPGNPRFFTYFHEDEIRQACLALGFSILDERITNERVSRGPSGRDQDWIYFLIRRV